MSVRYFLTYNAYFVWDDAETVESFQTWAATHYIPWFEIQSVQVTDDGRLAVTAIRNYGETEPVTDYIDRGQMIQAPNQVAVQVAAPDTTTG